MTEPAPRWQFKLSDLFVACSLAAVFFAVFTALPTKYADVHDRAWPALVFTAWIGCLVRQLRKGRLLSGPRIIALLLLPPILGVEYVALRPWPPEGQADLLVLLIGTAGFTALSIALSWMYERSSRR